MIINDSVYGKIEFSKSIDNIIHSEPLQRLKNIHQGGAMFLAYPAIKTSRFEHSLGVCNLIRILGGDEKEQIAGLLHDISHTAFSHVVDYVLGDREEDFHEKHKLRFLLNEGLVLNLRSLGLEPEEFLEDDKFHLLEADHPALCADRIDYTLRDLIAWGKISQLEAQQFINSLQVIEDKIVVKSINLGEWFKDNYEYLNHYIFRDRKNILANAELAKLIKKALLINALCLEDLFNDDNFVMNIIQKNVLLKEDLKQIKNNLDREVAPDLKFKDRIVDPLVIDDEQIKLLSECHGIKSDRSIS